MAKANMKFRLRDDDEAIVGVGTLIVFVATILVAAIASGVIIKTAYSLKDQAEKTGLAARNEVTGGPKVIDIIGDRQNPPTANIQLIKFTITTWEGSDAINLQYMIIHWIGPSQQYYLSQHISAVPSQWENPTGPPNPTYGSEERPAGTAGNGYDPVNGRYYLDDDNVVEIDLDISNAATGINDPLAPGAHVTVVFIPAHGPAVTEEFVTPNDYGSARWIDLTNT